MRMMKKMIIVLVVIVFSFSSLFLLASCAKKTGKVEEVTKPAPGPAKTEPRPSAPAPESRETGKDTRIAALEAAQKLRAEIKAFEADNIYFDFDRSELKAKAKASLTKKAAWLRAHPGYSVKIAGHCDERGTNEYNLALGERRALAAFKFLNALGVAGGKISTVSYGEERPASAGHNETAWAKNRRDVFRLIKK